jgi:hypothetical protein
LHGSPPVSFFKEGRFSPRKPVPANVRSRRPGAAKLQHSPQFAANPPALSVTSGDIHDILIDGLISEADFCSKWFGSQRKWTLPDRKFDANVCGFAAAREPR